MTHEAEVLLGLNPSNDQTRALGELGRIMEESSRSGTVVDLEEIRHLMHRVHPTSWYASLVREAQKDSTLASALKWLLYEVIIENRAVMQHAGDRRRALEKRVVDLEAKIEALTQQQQREADGEDVGCFTDIMKQLGPADLEAREAADLDEVEHLAGQAACEAFESERHPADR
jgi:hypothetical protein